MSCHECGFCQADLSALENVTRDIRSRGNYKIATLLDAALEKCGVLRENLNADNREYLKNISRTAKTRTRSNMATNILRDAKRVVEQTKGQQSPEPTMREIGFGGMFAASRRGSNAPTPEHTEPELRSRSGLIRMLEESSRNASSEEPIQRALDEIVADEAKYATTVERVNENMIPRNGVMTMFERVCASRTRDEPEPEIRGRYGFRAMLDGASKGTTDDTLDKKSGFHRGMGFGAMLEGARTGTE